jgi:tetratricopeptide (TPR) repeat protein
VALLRQLTANGGQLEDLTNLGLALLLTARYPEAESSFRLALARSPGAPQPWLNLADSLWLQGRRPEALAAYREVVSATEGPAPPWPALSARAQALAHLGQPRLALAALEQALRQAPDSPQLALEAALVHLRVGDETSALLQAERALDHGVAAHWLELPWFASLRPQLKARESRSGPPRS